MANPARKLARQNKRDSGEAKAEAKEKPTDQRPISGPVQQHGMRPGGKDNVPTMQIRQRRAGNS